MPENSHSQALVDIIQKEVSQAIIRIISDQDVPIIEVKKEFLLEFCRFLHDDPRLDFDYLSFLTALDYPQREQRFVVVYQLYSVKLGHSLRLKVPLREEGAEVASVTPVWEAANLLEREVFDMFGIVFTSHPDLRRIYMPDDWEGYPLRKDYPLKGYNN